MHDHAIDKEHRAEFQPPHLFGFLAQYRIVLDLGLALEAQEVEIGDAVEDARFREMLADHAAIFRGVRITVQVHQVERHWLLAEHVLDREVIRVIEALDPAALQFGRVGIDLGHVVAGDKRHLISETLQGQDVLKGSVGSGVLIRLGHRIVDHQGALAHTALGFQLGHFAIEAVSRERVLPAIEEFAVIDRLETLDPGAGDTGAGARPFEMDDFRGGLHHGAVAELAHLEAEIGVFVIKRDVVLVELAELLEQTRLDHQCGARHVIRIAHIAKARIVGILIAPPVPAVTHAPDDAAAFLQSAVWIQQFRPGDADLVVTAHRLVQLIEPERLHLRVVVQEHDILAARHLKAAVAGPDKAQIGDIAHQPHAAGEDKARE